MPQDMLFESVVRLFPFSVFGSYLLGFALGELYMPSVMFLLALLSKTGCPGAQQTPQLLLDISSILLTF